MFGFRTAVRLANQRHAALLSREEEEGQVRMKLGWNRLRPAVALLALVASVSMLAAACGSSDKSSTSTGGGAATSASTTPKTAAATAKCGLGNGKKATGEPIKLGGIAVKQPGT